MICQHTMLSSFVLTVAAVLSACFSCNLQLANAAL
jgi:hypothetical protein